MSLRFPEARRVVFFLMICIPFASIVSAQELRVCADPDNLPFSNSKQQGFENKIATLIAHDLHLNLVYIWQRMGPGFIREYLNSSKCDVLTGIPTDYRQALATVPYYRSRYVFVFRRDAEFKPSSLNDAGLHRVKIGIQALNEEYAPPGEALARRGLQDQIVAFKSIGQGPAQIIEAVRNRQIGLAIVWGPSAGYFARPYRKVLELSPLVPDFDPPGLPLTFEISMGVRKGDERLRTLLNRVLLQRKQEIANILKTYGVPQLNFRTQTELGD